MHSVTVGLFLALGLLFFFWLAVRRVLLEPRLRRKREMNSLLQVYAAGGWGVTRPHFLAARETAVAEEVRQRWHELEHPMPAALLALQPAAGADAAEAGQETPSAGRFQEFLQALQSPSH